MGTNYKKHFSTRNAKQGQKIPGTRQVENSDGAYVFDVGSWGRLDRFLILGSEGGSYYASEQKLTVENAENVLGCIKEDGPKTVARIVEISDGGRAPKNDPAIFALAMCAKLGDAETRRAAYQALPKVCRIPTHLFHFADFCSGFGGWGRGMRRAIANWYTDKSASKLAYHLVKYQARDGWSNRDLLRLAHAVPKNEFQSGLFRWVTSNDTKSPIKGMDATSSYSKEELAAANFVSAFERAKNADNIDEAVELVTNYGLPREAVPTKFLTQPQIWEALLPQMPLGAMVRNLGNMSRSGLLVPLSAAAKQVVDKLGDKDAISKSRLHPLQILMALKTYGQGRGTKGSGTWKPVPTVVGALDDAFYTAFESIQPTGRSHLLCLDTSLSMTWSPIAGMAGITPREASAVMAMVTAKTEKNNLFVSYSDQANEMEITGRWRLQEVIDRIQRAPAAGTNCAAPIELAIKRGYDVDTIILYTDSETNHRNARHPVVALRDLRERLGHDVRFVVVGMVSNGFSVADPEDRGMLDLVGFDAAAPQIISSFSAGKI